MHSDSQDSYFKLQITTHSPEETRQFGQTLGRQIQTPAVIALWGDLGSGKTTLVQGLARGLGVPDSYYITSPTYTLINEYPGRYTFFHVDLYRIDRSVDFEDIGLYEILYNSGVVAIEWADRLNENLPAEHLKIQLEISSDEVRKICITAYGLEAVNLLKSLDRKQGHQHNGR